MRRALIPGLVLFSLFAAASAGRAQTTASGTSNALNPAISLNALLLGQRADRAEDRRYNGVDLQEAELRLTSIVDPYWKANFVLAVHPEHGHDAHAEEGEEPLEPAASEPRHYALDVETATVEATALPGRFGLLVGKDYLPFGKHAPLHTHQWPFVQAPVGIASFLGDHSPSEVGARLSREVPLPWYVDAAVYAVDGRSVVFDGESRDPAWGARLVNLWDLSDESTLELSGSFLRGRIAPGYNLQPQITGGHLNAWGVDLTYKWVSSARSQGPAMNLTFELLAPRPEQGGATPEGMYALAQFRVARQWWLGVTAGRADRDHPAEVQPEDPGGEDGHAELFAWEKVNEYKANLNWTPSEFSAVRLEAARYDDRAGDADDWLFSLQVNFTIGAHPAHSY